MADNNKKVPAAPKKKRGSIGEYFRGIKTEMKKVVWPTKKELGSFTAVVLINVDFLHLRSGVWTQQYSQC